MISRVAIAVSPSYADNYARHALKRGIADLAARERLLERSTGEKL